MECPDEIVHRARQNIAAADAQSRAPREGTDPDVIIRDFVFCGPLVDLAGEQLRAYAEAVSAGRPFPLSIARSAR